MMYRILMVASAVLLSACCPFGYVDSSHTDWEGSGLTNLEVPSIKANCAAQQVQEQEVAKRNFHKMVKQECTKDSPFNDKMFVNPSTGVKYREIEQATLRQSLADALCPKWRDKQQVSEDLLDRYCYSCSNFPDLSTCYENHGLHKVTRDGLACKQLSW
jgi:hypothetical protein